jgi:hypothetical protein
MNRLRISPMNGVPPASGDCVWGYDESLGVEGWVECDVLEHIFPVRQRDTLPTLCPVDHTHDEDCDELWWWVENDVGERFALQSIDVEEVD